MLVSMAASDADSAPRGIDFLFEKNRLNVALSRGKVPVGWFCSPALLDVVCTDFPRMTLVNWCAWQMTLLEFRLGPHCAMIWSART